MALLYQLLGSKIWPPVDKQPDLSGRTLLITGANSGLGYEAALKFVRCSAKRVVLGVRSVEKGLAARQEILDQTKRPDTVIDVYQLDMLDYGSIQAFASRVSQEVSSLDYVILNAGVSPQTYKKSRYGYEQGIQVNLLSTTFLALLLLPRLMASKTDDFTPVLEMVGSGTHQRISKLLAGTDDTKMDPLEVYNSEESFASVGFMQQYSMTKLFLMYAQWQLVNLVADPNTKKPRAFVVVVGPGPTQSGLGRDTSEQPFAFRLAFSGMQMLMKTAEQGSRTYISGLMLGEQGHGQFWQWDSIDRPAKWCSDPLAIQRSNRVWTSIINGLRKDVEDIDSVVARVGSI